MQTRFTLGAVRNLRKYYPQLIRPQGAFYFFLRAPQNNAFKFSLHLLEAGVLVAPAFSTRRTHFRISYAGIKIRRINKLTTILKQAALVYTKS